MRYIKPPKNLPVVSLYMKEYFLSLGTRYLRTPWNVKEGYTVAEYIKHHGHVEYMVDVAVFQSELLMELLPDED